VIKLSKLPPKIINSLDITPLKSLKRKNIVAKVNTAKNEYNINKQ
jgi:hypothetical protein